MYVCVCIHMNGRWGRFVEDVRMFARLQPAPAPHEMLDRSGGAKHYWWRMDGWWQ